MKLTERDKRLLLMLAYFVLIVGFGAFVFRPLIRYYMDMGDRLVLLEAQKEEMDACLARGQGLEKRRNELADLFLVSTKEFYPMLGSEEVDKEITGIVVSCGMQAISLNIDMPKEGADLQWYLYAERGAEPSVESMQMGTADGLAAPESGDSGTEETGPGAEESGEDPQGYIYAPVVAITASGSSAQADELIDRLTRDYPAIRIRSYSRRMQRDEWTEGGAEYELLSLELELYMCDKSVAGQGEKL